MKRDYMKIAEKITIVAAVVGAALCISGCGNSIVSSQDYGGGIEVRPLGREVGAYTAPAAPGEDAHSPPAEPAGELAFSQALARVLMYNPELRGFSWDVRIAGARSLQAGLWPNPELQFDLEEIGGTGQRSGFDGAETTLALSQPIELGGKRQRRMEVAGAHQRLAQWEYEARRLEVYGRASKAFSQVVAGQQRVRLAGQQVELAERLSLAVAGRVEAGKDSPIEKTKSQIELSNSRIELASASAELEAARRRLVCLWSAEEPEFTEAVGTLDEIAEPGPYAGLRELTLKHPRVARWDDEIAAAKARLELEKAQATPDIAVVGGLRRLEEADENTLVLGLAIPLPLFDRNQAGRMEASYALAKTRELAREAEARILAQLADAHGRMVSTGHQVQALREEILPNAARAFEATLTGYERGKFDYLSVLDSQRTLFEVRQRAITSLVEYHKARADVESLIGQRLAVAGRENVSVANQEKLLQENSYER
jgi:cobalt-zinc-cadmium efflux system outer membrane protein